MRPRRRGVPLTVLGAVVVVLVAPVVAAAGFFLGVTRGLDTLSGAVAVPPGQSYHLGAGQRVTLFGYQHPSAGGNGVSVSAGGSPAKPCTVTGAGIGRITPSHPSGGIRITRSGATYAAAGSFTAPRDADYLIRCGAHPALIVGSAQVSDLRSTMLVPLVIGVVAAVLVGLAGILMLVVGIIAITRSRRARREFDLQQPASPGGLP